MNTMQSLLARRYATAFFNVHGARITSDDFYNMYAMTHFFAHNRGKFFFLTFTTIADSIKKQSLLDLCDMVHLGNVLEPLINLLVDSHRSYLFVDVVKQLVRIYKKRHTIQMFTIESSHALAQQDRELIKRFLAKKTGSDIIYEYKVNPSLIAGLRLQSETMVWEYSIRKQLENVRLHFIR